MFHLSTHEVKIAHLNVREERHGEESKLAVDIKLAGVVPNDFLSYLHPALKAALYGPREDQGSLIDDAGHLPALRFSALPSLRWVAQFTGFVTLHGAKQKDDLVMSGDIDKLVLEPMDGGSVGVTFRVQTLPEPGQVGKIANLLGTTVKVTVTPQEAEELSAVPA